MNFEAFQAMDTMAQIYWAIAIIASVIFLVQAVIVFCGFDSDSDFSGGDTDFDSSGFNIVSVKSIICFLLGYGWTGALLHNQITNGIYLALLALAIGCVFMLTIAFLMFQIKKLDKDNTFHTSDAVGKTGEVYLRIPASNNDSGKVVVSVAGTLHEIDAIGTDDKEIPTGAKIRVVEAIDEELVRVERI